MRPLRLELQGFTCFRDFTVIDFSNLELFAIVGQTGAGKSSILDALTFALFEQTPRLGSKPAKELISQGSSGMSLSLEFEASDGQIYRVARIYSSKSSEVRFERSEGGKWVTAVQETKKKEVAEAIERVVGLDFEAFTKAVLLPQGEFDRFLRGAPAQRRDLLKNLIGLERIEAMQKKAGELARQAKQTSEAMQVQLDGLVHATLDALEALEFEQTATQTALQNTNQSLELQRAELQEAREISRLQLAFEAINNEILALQADNEPINSSRERAQQARRIAGVLPLLEQLERLETRLAQSQHTLAAKQSQYAAAQQLEGQRLVALDTARDAALESVQLQAKVEALTALVPRVERLRALGGGLEERGQRSEEGFSEAAWSELERLEAELPLLEQTKKQLLELERRREELGQAGARLQVARAEWLEVQEQLMGVGEQQAVALVRLEAARVAAQEIPKLDKQWQQLEAQRPKLQRLNELGGKLSEAAAQAVAFSELAWARLETVQNEQKTHAKLLTSHLKTDVEVARDQVQHWATQRSETTVRLEAIKQEGLEAGATQKEIEAQLEAAKRENIAAELVRNSKIGDPCPVCGAPLKTLPDFGVSRVPVLQATLERAVQNVGRLRDEYTSLREAAKNHADNHTRAEAELAKIQQQLTDNTLEQQQLEQSWHDVLPDSSDPKSALQLARANLLSALAAELKAAGADNLDNQSKQLLTQKQTLEQTLGNAQQAHATSQALYARIESAVQAAQRLLTSRETEQESAQQEGLRLEKQRLDLEVERQAFNAKLEVWLGSSVQPSAALRRVKQELLAAFATELLEAGASATLASDIKKLQSHIKNLEQQATDAREAYSQAKTESASCLAAINAATANLELLLTDTQNAAQHCQTALEQLGLSDAQTARAYALPEKEIARLEQNVQQHTQQLATATQRRQEISLELGGRTLPTPPSSLEQQVRASEQQSQQYSTRLGQLEAQKTQLATQISQAKDLRREQNNFEKRFDIYQALSNDMKGNEFQDYLLTGVQQQLLLRATQTIKGITRDRFSLELIDAEFHVRDAWNGTESRGVKTLSGGESFIASLALALSLSDYLAGNQALGALFLDEGFGTLDADALEMVASTLESLNTTGRMVGIITHVPSLADRLPMRLIIEKAQDSSRVRWEE